MSADPPAPEAEYILRLYVAGPSLRSLAVFENVRKLCEDYLAGRYRIEIVDLKKNPELMEGDQILALPALVRRLPKPIRRIIGNLSNRERVLVGLDLRPEIQPRSPSRREDRMPDDVFAQIRNRKYILRLYVAGSTPQSGRAITNLKVICEAHLKGRYVLTVVDLYKNPGRAMEDQVMVAPTLVRLSPGPVRRVVGDLSKTGHVLAALDIIPAPAQP